MAAHKSTHERICPPNTLPRTLACVGSTYSVIIVIEASMRREAAGLKLIDRERSTQRDRDQRSSPLMSTDPDLVAESLCVSSATNRSPLDTLPNCPSSRMA